MPHWLVVVHEVQLPLVPVVVPPDDVVPLVLPMFPVCGHAQAPLEASQVAKPSQSLSLAQGFVESQKPSPARS